MKLRRTFVLGLGSLVTLTLIMTGIVLAGSSNAQQHNVSSRVAREQFELSLSLAHKLMLWEDAMIADHDPNEIALARATHARTAAPRMLSRAYELAVHEDALLDTEEARAETVMWASLRDDIAALEQLQRALDKNGRTLWQLRDEAEPIFARLQTELNKRATSEQVEISELEREEDAALAMISVQALSLGATVLILGLVLAAMLLPRYTRGLVALAEGATRIEAGVLNVPIPKEGDDELTALALRFNQMAAALATSIQREAAAAASRDLARQVGMADVATSVLHNVGNVLNSLNVSSSVVREKVESSSLNKLARLSALLDEHANDMVTFLTENPRGKPIPRYLSKVADELVTLQRDLTTELTLLDNHVMHIKHIISAQQEYARPGAAVETVQLPELLDAALALSGLDAALNTIVIDRQYGSLPEVTLDKHRFIQIVINLATNARHAVRDTNRAPGHISVRASSDGAHVKVEVQDDGVGISAADLPRIFKFGFSTKKDGHGFGLHASINAAIEMGGTLTAQSAGEGRGALFTLEIPLVMSSSVSSIRRAQIAGGGTNRTSESAARLPVATLTRRTG